MMNKNNLSTIFVRTDNTYECLWFFGAVEPECLKFNSHFHVDFMSFFILNKEKISPVELKYICM